MTEATMTEAPAADPLTEAAERRLCALLAPRLGADWSALVAELEGAEVATPRLRWGVLLVFAGASAARRIHGLTWERLNAILEHAPATARERQDAAQISRAIRLLQRLVLRGCLQRGEV